ncbi:MAG: hypothetical protein MMC23_007933 [Stictis urceolatum]|nr:hypothetical protein [Stictis urceolata]
MSLPALVERAGGPPAVPIPANCSINSIHPSIQSDSFALTPDFQKANEVYAYYLQEPTASVSWNESARIQQCLEQCYGIGTGCTSILWAHDVTYTAYGVQGTGIACLFMHTSISQDELSPVTNGSYTKAQALDIDCP